MSPAHERQWGATFARCVAWTLVVSAVAYSIYLTVPDEHQGIVIRVAAAAILGTVLMHIQKRLRSEFDDQAPSRFDMAQEIRQRAAKIDPHFIELETELRHSLESRQYFDRVLWPRLQGLGERQGVTLKQPPLRWLATRGPSLRDISELMSNIERKR
jgi:hypothetical protein